MASASSRWLEPSVFHMASTKDTMKSDSPTNPPTPGSESSYMPPRWSLMKAMSNKQHADEGSFPHLFYILRSIRTVPDRSPWWDTLKATSDYVLAHEQSATIRNYYVFILHLLHA
jgi:hypothetical protein